MGRVTAPAPTAVSLPGLATGSARGMVSRPTPTPPASAAGPDDLARPPGHWVPQSRKTEAVRPIHRATPRIPHRAQRFPGARGSSRAAPHSSPPAAARPGPHKGTARPGRAAFPQRFGATPHNKTAPGR
ncbi:hypothetical protein Acsp04_61030 [Actinomadura sp. NBRC 104425]|nr:hypothetical protein Acsp04_61030 [Actinomadura sp. NBRC 104425]